MLPFRITTADSLLGEGFAELLAQEFTGEGGPRSVEMSTTLSAWRRAGGGLRNPLAQDSARAVARRLGAGILCEGNIVGLGGRLSVTASLINSATGASVGAFARVAGPVDSVESLLRQVAAALLGTGANERMLKTARLSANPSALRSYLEGLTLWRQGQWPQAAAAFEASVNEDSSFGSALYQRWLFSQATDGSGGWGPRTRAHAALLTPRERAVFEGSAGVGQPRTRRQVYEERRRAAEQLGDSPEAWYFVGDYIYHNGQPIVGPDSAIPLARQFFSLAVDLDSQPVFLFHLMEIATTTRDTVLARRLLPAYERIQGEERWSRSWVIAAMLNDAALLDRLRRAGPPKGATSLSAYAILLGVDSPIPTPLLDEALVRLTRVTPLSVVVEFPSAASSRWIVNMARGRPASAEAALRQENNPPFTFGFVPALGLSGDATDSLVLRQVPNALRDTAPEQRRQCMIARLKLDRGETVSLDTASLRTTGRCRNILRAWAEFNANRLTDSALALVESTVAGSTLSNFYGFENRLLSRIYEARGDAASALRALRMHPRDSFGPWIGPTLREEGRLFLANRDTTRAIQSYQHFLELRVDAQPPYVAERDSIKALVAKLTQRIVP